MVLILGSVLACGSVVQQAQSDPPTRMDQTTGVPATVDAGVPFAVEVVEVHYGTGAGFGQAQMPEVVLGPPVGAGENKGSLHVVSLGKGGSITVRLGRDAVNGPGPDLIVFENAFRLAGGPNFFVEPGEVSVSEDGTTFTAFPCVSDQPPYPGCAGLKAVFASGADGGVSPVDPEHAGGDAFDLDDLGLSRVRFVRITDRTTPDPIPNTAGFDLDAVAVVPHDLGSTGE